MLAVNDVYHTINKTRKLDYFCYDTLDHEDNYVYIQNCDNSNTFDYKNLKTLIGKSSTELPLERMEQTNFNGTDDIEWINEWMNIELSIILTLIDLIRLSTLHLYFGHWRFA